VPREFPYRCLNCLDHTVVREFDVSHLTMTCPVCDSFERFVNGDVFDQYEVYESTPPADLDWGKLDRSEKLLVSEHVVRRGHSPADFAVEDSSAVNTQ
jgi:hypothetical protein